MASFGVDNMAVCCTSRIVGSIILSILHLSPPLMVCFESLMTSNDLNLCYIVTCLSAGGRLVH